MTTNPTSQLTWIAVAVIAIVVAASTTLIVTGHGGEATSLVTLIVALAPVIGLQLHTTGRVAQNEEKLGYVLNGGMTDRMQKVAVATITKLAASDETHGTTLVADAAANPAVLMPPPPPSIIEHEAKQAADNPPPAP